jgi:hypothetical protein
MKFNEKEVGNEQEKGYETRHVRWSLSRLDINIVVLEAGRFNDSPTYLCFGSGFC